MPNIIAKPFNITIDTISTKLVTNRDYVYTLGDSVEIFLTILEGGKSPKNLTDVKFRLLMANNDSPNPSEQIEGITIIDALQGKVKITLEGNMTDKLGRCLFQLIIEDLDEQISTQKFLFNVIDSLSSGVILEATDGLNTLAKLNQEIDNYTVALNDIKQHVSDISSDVDTEIISINNKLKTIDDSIIALDNKLNNTSDAIDRLPQVIDLIPTQIQGSSIWYFSTPIIKTSPLDLVKCAYDILVVGKCLNDSTVQTATIRLQFQRINNTNGVPTVKINTSTICDFSVQGRTVNATAVFDNMSDTISASATNYRLYIKSNVLVSLNFQSEIYSSMSSLGKNLTF